LLEFYSIIANFLSKYTATYINQNNLIP